MNKKASFPIFSFLMIYILSISVVYSFPYWEKSTGSFQSHYFLYNKPITTTDLVNRI
jgi:hypothetical protein